MRQKLFRLVKTKSNFEWLCIKTLTVLSGDEEMED